MVGVTLLSRPSFFLRQRFRELHQGALPADAAAICEAVTRPTMRFVPIKTAEQQATLTVHRTRDLLISQRTQLINALPAHLAELGLVANRSASLDER